MQNPKRSLRCLCLACAGISLLLCSGCITVPKSALTEEMANQPLQSPVQIDASATVVATVTVTPEVWGKWKIATFSDETLANYRDTLEETLRNDIVASGLFARIETGSKADFAVKVKWVESTKVTCALSATEAATGEQTTTQPHTYPGVTGFRWDETALGRTWSNALPAFMAIIKTELAEKLLANLNRKQAQADKILFAKASLTELIAGIDKNAASANERNQAIIVAKNQQLPVLLRENKTEQLSALVITIEQTTLTLNHEGELAKDHAQQLTAAGGNARQIDELRGLAISYQERIELLKPIAAALKEEIANRNR
jgi:hypothetical protein